MHGCASTHAHTRTRAHIHTHTLAWKKSSAYEECVRLQRRRLIQTLWSVGALRGMARVRDGQVLMKCRGGRDEWKDNVNFRIKVREFVYVFGGAATKTSEGLRNCQKLRIFFIFSTLPRPWEPSACCRWNKEEDHICVFVFFVFLRT